MESVNNSMSDKWEAEGAEAEVVQPQSNESQDPAHLLLLEEELLTSDIGDIQVKIEVENDQKHWTEELACLLGSPDELVLSEWKEGDADEESATSTCERKNKMCPVCGEEAGSKLQCHLVLKHLPWFVSHKQPCWQCERSVGQASRFDRHEKEVGCHGGQFQEKHMLQWVMLVNQMLRFFAEKFHLPTVSSLLDFVRSEPDLHPPKQMPFIESVQELMVLFEKANNIFPVEGRQYQMRPPTV